MHGDTQRDLMQFLNSAANEALARHYGDRPAARLDLERAIRNNRQFDWANASILAERYERARASCAVLDLSDPRLRAGGGQRRPLSLDESW
jgi:hypothetical protein